MHTTQFWVIFDEIGKKEPGSFIKVQKLQAYPKSLCILIKRWIAGVRNSICSDCEKEVYSVNCRNTARRATRWWFLESLLVVLSRNISFQLDKLIWWKLTNTGQLFDGLGWNDIHTGRVKILHRRNAICPQLYEIFKTKFPDLYGSNTVILLLSKFKRIITFMDISDYFRCF